MVFLSLAVAEVLVFKRIQNMKHGTNVEKNHKQLEMNHITSKSKKPIKSEHLEINEQFHEPL